MDNIIDTMELTPEDKEELKTYDIKSMTEEGQKACTRARDFIDVLVTESIIDFATEKLNWTYDQGDKATELIKQSELYKKLTRWYASEFIKGFEENWFFISG